MNTDNPDTSASEPEEFLFTCKDCGSHELYVEHFYIQRQGRSWTEYVERGTLGDDHRVSEWDSAEEVESGEEDAASAEDEGEPDRVEVDPDSHEFFVRCEGCDREIEFGWSHPNRGGRFWPSECTDFNPWRCWPEPRYRDVWAKKGWLRPSGERKA